MALLKKLTGKTSDLPSPGKTNKKNDPSNYAAATLTEHTDIRLRQPLYARMVQNFLITWLDRNIDENNCDYHDTIMELRQVTNNVHIFTDVDSCINFITNTKGQKVFMISSGAMGQTTVPLVNDMHQISAIYIFCTDKARHEQWAQNYSKVKGVITEITDLCEAIKKATQNYDQSTVSMSFIPANSESTTQSLDQINQSFTYIHILKEILLDFDFNEKYLERFSDYCEKQFNRNSIELKNAKALKTEYLANDVIRWYTADNFLCPMFNRAVHNMNIDIMIRMGFLIRDLHDYIVHLHSKNFATNNRFTPFTVYHGQGLSQADFDQLKKTKGGLLIFNSFLSTTTIEEKSVEFARKIAANSNLVSIHFVISIDPSTPSTPFANIDGYSSYLAKDEILFSMCSVFRITEIKQVDNRFCLWQVNLTEVPDHDTQLHALTERIRKETLSNTQGWHRLGRLFIQHGQLNKAEEMYLALLDQVTEENQKASIYYHLGSIKSDQGEYREAVKFYENSIEIDKIKFAPTNPRFIAPYSGIGQAYSKMGECSKALSYYEKAHKIAEEALPKNDPGLATSYNNIGSVYSKMGEYSKALSAYENAIDIAQRSNHPNLRTFRQNIEVVKKKI